MIKSEEEERCLHQRSVVPANPLTLRPSVRRHGGATYADEELIRGFLADDRASRRDGTTWTRRYRRHLSSSSDFIMPAQRECEADLPRTAKGQSSSSSSRAR